MRLDEFKKYVRQQMDKDFCEFPQEEIEKYFNDKSCQNYIETSFREAQKQITDPKVKGHIIDMYDVVINVSYCLRFMY